jgi:hypothetical protein
MERLVELVLSQHSPGKTEENQKNPQLGQQRAIRDSNWVPPNISLECYHYTTSPCDTCFRTPLLKAHHWK